jgi:ankyrin repeat protein
VNAKDAEGHTPLWFAVQSEENPAGRPAMFELLASRGGDLQARFEKGRTLLHVAARVGTYRTDIRLFVDGVRWLLDKGLSPKARDQEGGTPAFVAAKAHNYPVAKLLVDSASDWDPDELGKIAIEALDNEAWLRELIERKKANINVRDGFGRTLLHKAAIKNSVKLARYLLDHGADPSVRNGFGETWLEEDAAGESFRQAFPPAPPKP